jgi:hypothetical protein
MLYNPDYSLPFHLATDASNCGMGSMLYQIKGYDKSPEGKEQMLKEMGFEPEDSKNYTFIPGISPRKSCPVATNFLSNPDALEGTIEKETIFSDTNMKES